MRKTLIWDHFGCTLSTCDTQPKTGLVIHLALEPRHFRQGMFDEPQVSWTRASKIKRTNLAHVPFSVVQYRYSACVSNDLACLSMRNMDLRQWRQGRPAVIG